MPNIMQVCPGLHLAGGLPVLSSSLFLIIGVILGIRAKKREVKNGLSYKDAFFGGTTIAFIAGIILGCYAYLYVQTIDPDFVKRALYSLNNKMEEYHFTDAEKKTRIESYANFLSPASQFISAIGTSVIIGAVVSCIASFFFRRKTPNPPKGDLLS